MNAPLSLLAELRRRGFQVSLTIEDKIAVDASKDAGPAEHRQAAEAVRRNKPWFLWLLAVERTCACRVKRSETYIPKRGADAVTSFLFEDDGEPFPLLPNGCLPRRNQR